MQTYAFNPTNPIAANLENIKTAGVPVEVYLRSGNSFRGIVAEVRDHFVHLTQLSQREFFDALVRLDDIVALEARARTS